MDHVDLICCLVQLAGRFWVFCLSHTAPGFQLWFHFHLCMWVIRWGLLLRLPWRTWVCPSEGQVRRWYSCLGHRGSDSTRYSGSWARAARNIEGYGNPLQYSCLEKPSDREAWQATVHRVAKSWTQLRLLHVHRHKTFFFFLPEAALPQ